MKLCSWNVNGIRAVLKKGFLDFLQEVDPDVLALQEVKAEREQVELELPQYEIYWNSAERKGYSGTARYDKTDFYLFPPTSFEDGFYRAGVDCTVANDENCEKVLWYTVKGENGYKDGMIREMTYSKSKKSGNYSLENLIQASIKGERWARQALIIYLLSTYKKRLFSYSKGLYCYRMTKEERLLEIKQYERLKMLKEMHMKPERKAKHKTLATQQKTKN